MKVSLWLTSLSLYSLLSCNVELPPGVQAAYEGLPEKIDYNFHIKPILSDRCYQCHGPDENARKANLRLDIEENAFSELKSGGYAFVPGKVRNSEAIRRILSSDPEVTMPHPESKLNLNAEDIATLVKWVEQGAEWKPHWSFTPPQRPQVPADFPAEWIADNPIDNFIYSKLHRTGLRPSKPADKERLLRRVSMDIAGLPPSIEEIDDFMRDQSPDAYERAVDRLLATEDFGERLALDWMDVSRYADSHGLHADGWRMMWPWRDWVINVFNENLPYNEFVTWQLAGDLLPNPTKEQILATAFHRNHPMTAEGGAVDEEFRVEYVADRTNTTATAFLGLTMECSRCHDHKFDPITQEEYYMMSAFFNNQKELGMTGNDGNFGPTLLWGDNESEQQLAAIEEQIERKEKEIEVSRENLKKVSDFISNIQVPKNPRGLVGHYPFDNGEVVRNEEAKEGLGGRDSKRDYITVLDGNKSAFSNGRPKLTQSKLGNAVLFSGDGYDEVYLEDVGLFELYEPFSGSAWIQTSQWDSTKTQAIMGTAGNKDNLWRGWDLYLDGSNVLCFRLISCLPHNYLHVSSAVSVEPDQWTNVAFTYNGSANANGVRLFINGKRIETIVEYDQLYKSILPITMSDHSRDPRPVRVGKSYRAFTGEDGIFNGQIDDIWLYNRNLTEIEIGVTAGNAIDPSKEQLLEYAIDRNGSYQKQVAELTELRKEWLAIMNETPEIMVMEEMPEPRITNVLYRGQYDSPMEQVTFGTPGGVLPFPDDLPKNRLGLAQWLFSEKNPLTARVTINRYWQLFFGRGLVKT